MSFILVIIIISLIFYFTILYDSTPNVDEKSYTNKYTLISIENAYDLIYNKSVEMIIIDVPTTSLIRYNESHLENARMIFDQESLPEGMNSLINTTKNILIYDDDGRESGIQYCEEILNKVYGDIYYLEGGINSWMDKNYPVWTNSPE